MSNYERYETLHYLINEKHSKTLILTYRISERMHAHYRTVYKKNDVNMTLMTAHCKQTLSKELYEYDVHGCPLWKTTNKTDSGI